MLKPSPLCRRLRLVPISNSLVLPPFRHALTRRFSFWIRGVVSLRSVHGVFFFWHSGPFFEEFLVKVAVPAGLDVERSWCRLLKL